MVLLCCGTYLWCVRLGHQRDTQHGLPMMQGGLSKMLQMQKLHQPRQPTNGQAVWPGSTEMLWLARCTQAAHTNASWLESPPPPHHEISHGVSSKQVDYHHTCTNRPMKAHRCCSQSIKINSLLEGINVSLRHPLIQTPPLSLHH